MNCQFCQNEFDAYLEGRLSEGLENQVKEHLTNCMECSESYRLLILANKVIEAEKQTNSNPFLVTRVMAGIEELELGSSSIPEHLPIRQLLKPALISLSMAAAIFIGIIVGNFYLSDVPGHKVPVELTYMDDATLESVNFYSQL